MMKNTVKQSGLPILFLFFLLTTTIKAQTSDRELVYIKIEIKGLACPFCAFGMEKELKKVTGVRNVEIELTEGLAYISTPKKQQPTREALEKIIEEAGFTVGEIEFGKTPFKIKKGDKK